MYTSFYKLDIKPFQISSDPKFLWLGEKHKEALATLKYGVLDNKGFLLLTGDVGTGKTTLIHSLIESLSEDIIYASVSDPSLQKLDFFNFIAQEFGLPEQFASKGAFLVQFRKLLLNAHANNKKVLLIIDEAQLLTQELLEEIRLLSNIEKTHVKLINIFFVGQNEFNDTLNQVQNRAVRQRLTLNYNIDPLTAQETCDYVKYRLKIAGAKEDIFDPAALQEVFVHSEGFPRRINVICDHALLSGYVKETRQISIDIVRECAKELKLPVYSRSSHQPQSDASQGLLSGSQPGQQPNMLQPVAQQGFQSQGQPATAAPRQVIVQAAAYDEEHQNKMVRPILLGIIGLILLFILGVWIFFPDTVLRFRQSEYQLPAKTQQTTIRANDQKKNQTNEPPKKEVKGVTNKAGQTNAVEQTSVVIPIKQAVVADSDVDSTGKKKNLIQKSDGSSPDINDPLIAKSPSQTKSVVQPLPTEKIIIRFQHNSNEFSAQGFATLQAFADILSQHPEARVKIIGYSDSDGYKKYNDKLSEFRANIVRSFLLGRGAVPEQLEVEGRGSLNPVESNDTVWGRMMNRRVEIEVLR